MKTFSSKAYKITIILLVLLLIASGVCIVYLVSANRVNTKNRLPGIDYSAGNANDNAATDKSKQSGSLGSNTPTPTPTDTNIGITFVAAGQDQNGGPVVVKALLQNITSGVCHLTLKQGEKVVDKTVSIVRQSNYYTCDGFSIPFADVQAGGAQLTLNVTATNGASNYATKNITIQ